jgi:hypothetical protein
MKTPLDTAHTWFLESCTQLASGELRIRLAEGSKGPERAPMQIAAGVAGSYFPVTVESSKRAVDVIFENALALFTYNESYDAGDLELAADDRAKLRKVSASSFRKHASASTSIFELVTEPITEWFLWTEDQVFQILSTTEPTIVEVPEGPDLTIARHETWTAS